MREMQLKAIYPGPNTSKRNLQEKVHPYLLSGLAITRIKQAWQVDITYLRTGNGFVYLVAYIDMYSRLIMGWRLSNNLCTLSCLTALEDAIAKYGRPDIINSDQGSQFTSEIWVQELKNQGVMISMTGKGRCTDNANIERLWRSFKYEGSYLYKWHTISELKDNIPKWVNWYNNDRPHQALDYLTPDEKYRGFMDKSIDLPTTPQYLQLQNQNFRICSF
jgi:putative transposase